jgi:hypothetical protein
MLFLDMFRVDRGFHYLCERFSRQSFLSKLDLSYMSFRRPNDRLCRLSKLHCADECEYHHFQPEFRINSVHAGSCLQLDEYLILDGHEFFDKRHAIHHYLCYHNLICRYASASNRNPNANPNANPDPDSDDV